MSLTDKERALLRDLQAVLRKHGAKLIAYLDDVGLVSIDYKEGDVGLFFPELTGTSFDAESFTQADIDGSADDRQTYD